MNYADALTELRKAMGNERVAISALASLRDLWEQASDETRARWLKFWQLDKAPEWLVEKLERK